MLPFLKKNNCLNKSNESSSNWQFKLNYLAILRSFASTTWKKIIRVKKGHIRILCNGLELACNWD